MKGKSHVVANLAKYFRVSKIKIFTPSKNKILYLSMNLYKGHFGTNNGFINDVPEKAKQESYFVKKVLEAFPSIDYKPYNIRKFEVNIKIQY